MECNYSVVCGNLFQRHGRDVFHYKAMERPNFGQANENFENHIGNTPLKRMFIIHAALCIAQFSTNLILRKIFLEHSNSYKQNTKIHQIISDSAFEHGSTLYNDMGEFNCSKLVF